MGSEFDTKTFSKQVVGTLAKSTPPLLLAGLIAATTLQLTWEAGRFFGSWPQALLLELVALSCVAWWPKDALSWIFRGVVILGTFGLVVSGASRHAADPYLLADNLKPADKLKVEALNADITSMSATVGALSKQPRNQAMANQKLLELISRRDAIMDSMETDASLVAANTIAILTAICFRIVLQLGNWLLAHRLALFLRPGKEAQGAKETTTTEAQVIPLSLPSLPLEDDERRLLGWISGKGSVSRAQLLQSKQMDGQAAYDAALDRLIRSGAVSCTAAGPMAGWTYTSNNGNGREVHHG